MSENRWKNVVWDNKEKKNQHNLAEKLEKCKKVKIFSRKWSRKERKLTERKNVIMRQLKRRERYHEIYCNRGMGKGRKGKKKNTKVKGGKRGKELR